MKRRMLAILLAGSMVLTQALPAFAAEDVGISYEEELLTEAPEEYTVEDALPDGADLDAGADDQGASEAAAADSPDDAEPVLDAVGDDFVQTEDTQQGAEEDASAETYDETDAVEEAEEEPELQEPCDEPEPESEEPVIDAAADKEADDEATELAGAPDLEVDYEKEEDREMLPDWDGNINGFYNADVSRGDGDSYEDAYEVLDVKVLDGEECLADFHPDSDDHNHWWYYRVGEPGVVTFELTCTDVLDTTKTWSYQFSLLIVDDYYDVEVDSEDGSNRVLSGRSVNLIAEASHSISRKEDDYWHNEDVSTETVIYHWENADWDMDDARKDLLESIEEDPEDSSRCVVKFKEIPEDLIPEEGFWQDYGIRVWISDSADENNPNTEKASREYRISLAQGYTEAWPTKITPYVEVGEEVPIFPELRSYSADGETEYESINPIHVRWEYDPECVEIRDEDGKVVGNYDKDGKYNDSDSSKGDRPGFTIRRLTSDQTEIEMLLDAQDEDGNWTDEDGNYQEWERSRFTFYNKDYGVWFDTGDGNSDVFIDSTREFPLCLSGFDSEFWTTRKDDIELKFTVGKWDDEEERFTEEFAEGDGWSFDRETSRIHFDGKEISKKFGETDFNLETRVEACYDGLLLCEEQQGFHFREPGMWDYWGDEQRFPGESFFIGEDEGREIHLWNSDYPDEASLRVKVRKVEAESEEDEYDPRDVVTVERIDNDEDENHGWELCAVRGGEARITLWLDLYDGNDYYDQVTQSFMVWVSDFRASINLMLTTASDQRLIGESVGLIPKTSAEYQDFETGEQSSVDVSQNEIRYEVWVDEDDIDWDWLEKQGIDYDEKTMFYDTFWNAYGAEGTALQLEEAYGASEGDGLVYVCTVSGDNRTLTLNSIEGEDGTPWMDIRVRAILMDHDENNPDNKWEIARQERDIKFGDETYEIRLEEEWDSGLPVGAATTIKPSLYHLADGREELIDGRNVSFYLEGVDDNAVSYEGPDESNAFVIRRKENWDTGFDLVASFEDGDGEWQEERTHLEFDQFDFETSFSTAPDRVNGDRPPRFYTSESFTAGFDVTKLEALKKEGYNISWELQAGRWSWNEETGEEFFDDLYTYDVETEGENEGRRIEGSEKVYTGLSDHMNDHALSLEGGEELEEIWRALRYQDNPWGDDVVGFDLRLIVRIDGEDVWEECREIQISDSLCRMEDDDAWIHPGTRFYYLDGKARFYLEDEDHNTGNDVDDERGTYFTVSITDIELIDGETDKFEAKKEGNDWFIYAKESGEVKVRYIFAGGPEGRTSHETWLHCNETLYEVEVNEYYDLLLGEEDIPIDAKLVSITYDREKGIFHREDVPASDYRIWYEEVNTEMINIDEAKGTISALDRTGKTDFRVCIAKQDELDDYVDERRVTVYIDTSRAELDIDDAIVPYLSPGEKFGIDGFRVLFPDSILVKSVKNPAGNKQAVKEYWFLDGDGRFLTLSGPNGINKMPMDTLEVSSKALEGVRKGQSIESWIQICAVSEKDVTASDTVRIVIHEHNWGTPTYTWAPDNKTVTAARKCTVSGCVREETETAAAAAKVTTPATCTAKGKTTYTAAFKNAAFAAQTKTVEDIAPLGHKWDNGTVTKEPTTTSEGVRTYTCKNNSSHTYTEPIAKLPQPAKVEKKAQPMTVKAKKPSVKQSKLAKKKQTISKAKAFTIKNAQGTVTFKKVSKGSSKKLTISSTGKITVKKGTKSGTYKIKVTVTASGNDAYEAGSKTVTVKVKVK